MAKMAEAFPDFERIHARRFRPACPNLGNLCSILLSYGDQMPV